MNLLEAAYLFMGGYVVVVVLAALVMTLRGGRGEIAEIAETESLPPRLLRQQSGVMPRKAWGFRPPVAHSHYAPAPWQVDPPQSEEASLENVDRATEIKRDLGSEHPPWERLDRRGL